MKKLIVWLLIFSMIFTLTSAYGEERCDLTRQQIPINQSSADILSKLKILIGTNNGLELDREITRAEAVTVLLRLYPEKLDADMELTPVFDDMNNHWAYKNVTTAYKLGLVEGTSATTFTPNRTVTGKEFTKMLLSIMGYENITIENAYDKGKETFLLNNNYTKSVVYNNYNLLRGDVANICLSSLITKCGDDVMLKDKLIQAGKYEEKDFEVLYSRDSVDKEAFADKLYERMPKDKNYMYSPLSIEMAFMMAANGADGETKEEILSALGIDSIEKYNEFARYIIDKYSASDIIRLNIANSIWMNTDNTVLDFSDNYKDTILKYYDGKADTVTNKNAVNVVNDWVSEKTNEKIPSILTTTDFDALLINAIYFKAAWEDAFNEYATTKDKFTDRDGKTSNIDFMNKASHMNYFGNDAVRIVELPYKTFKDNITEDGDYLGTDSMENTDISMYVISSNRNLNPEQLIRTYRSTDSFNNTYVKLSMPKFKIEFEAELCDIMKNIGINKAFTKEADFMSMFDTGNMYISNALHKTFIDVDEKGTEAAAVTAIMMKTTAVRMPENPIEFKLDKPFTFVIYDNINNYALFIGEYAFTN